ncbi:MAG TPA: phosphate/phosphite/phosphonate ABC transporter substrate-binding protein [Candidatus Ozemobacteraceae bacterium]|nr:phosphate/phosphite/phosphonate ABC transporter substrate-binding protein [Candidatus Ozemobacteraceae bacterium]
MKTLRLDLLRLARSLAAFLLLCLVAGCGGGGEEPMLRLETDERPPVEFGVFPFLESGQLEAALAPLTAYLSARLGRDVRIRVVADYTDLERLVRQRRVDIGWFAPRSRAGGAEGVMLPVCRPKTSAGSYHGVIVTRRDSGIRHLDDLASRSFAYVDRGSKSGFFEPNRVLVRAGIDPLRFFGRISWAGNHEKALQGVLDGRWDAAAVTSLVLRPGVSGDLDRLIVIATTPPILTDPIVVRDGRTDLGSDTVKGLLLGISSDEAGRKAIASLSVSLGIFGFEPVAEVER